MLATLPGVLCCLIHEHTPCPKKGPEEAQHMSSRPVTYSMVVGRNGSPAHHSSLLSAKPHRVCDGVCHSVQRLLAIKLRLLQCWSHHHCAPVLCWCSL